MADPFENLRGLLEQKNYPSIYLYKFIVKQDQDKILAVKRCFGEAAEFATKESKNGKYISITIKEMMLNSESIIDRYKEVGKIKDVIKL